MTDLPTRLEQATAGSRELGHEVLLHFGWRRGLVGHFYGPLYQWSSPDFSPHLISGDEDRLPNPSLSIDAAVALAERVLPGWAYGLHGEIGGGALATLEQPGVDLGGGVIASPGIADLEEFEGEAATPALALCAAIIRAQAEQVQG